MLRKLLFASTAVCAMSGAAFAADLTEPAPAPVPYIQAVPIFTWTGFYIGVQGGYAFGRSNETFFLLPNTPAFQGTQSYDVNGGIFGGVIGVNYQINSFVLGLEGEGNWASVTGSSGVINVGPPNKGDTYTTSLNWYGAVKGRLGYAIDRTLLYVDGGVAFGGTRHAYLAALNGGAGNTFIQNATKSGFIVGGGLEYAFTTNLTGKVEYDYLNLGNSTILYSGAPTNRSVWKDNYNVIKVGLNYKF